MPANKANDNVTPQHVHRTDLAKREKARKKYVKEVKRWVVIKPSDSHPKGGKVLLKQKMNNGNVHTSYVGREKECADVLKKFKKEGLLD